MFTFPFNRKKKDEEIKDLDSIEPIKPIRRRRKKEEPAKPWGKIERIIVFIFLIGAPILSILFLIHAKNSKTAKPLPATPAIISNIIPGPTPNTNQLENELTNETQNLTGTYGIWVQALDNSFSLGINENTQFEGASLFKLPLMIGYYEEVDKGTIDPNTNYTLKYSDEESGAGIIANMPVGTVITYHDIVEAMGKDSDNTGFEIMTNVLPENEEANIINQFGMTDTDFSQSQTTPADMGLLFYKLMNENIISNNSKTELLSFLEKTDFENLIPAGVPSNITVAHKYGALDNTLNDAGIVFASKPFVLVILSKDVDLNEAGTEIPKIAQIVYNWENGSNN